MYLTQISGYRRLLEPFLVFLLSSIGGTYCARLLYQDLKNTQTGAGTPIATLRDGSNEIRRKTRSSLLWSPIEKGASLFLRDAISVGPLGYATIETTDHSLIEIGPDSLVQLNDLKDFTTGFLRGTFIVRTASGDTKVEVKKNGLKNTERISIRLNGPHPGQLLFTETSEAVPISFNWSVQKNTLPSDSSNYFLEISDSPTFSIKQRHKLEDLTGGGLTLPLKDRGRVFWRISGDKKILTETRRFEIILIEKPNITSIRGATVFWAPFAYHSLPLLVEVDGKTMANPQRFSLSPSATQVTLGGLKDGTYSVRLIRPFGEREIASDPRTLTLQREIPYELSSLQPTPDTQLPYSKTVLFLWKTNSPKVPVLLEVEHDGKVVHSKTLSVQSYIWKDETHGSFRWRLVPQKKLPPSEWSNFTRLAKVVEEPPPPSAPPQKRTRLRAPQDLSVEVE